MSQRRPTRPAIETPNGWFVGQWPGQAAVSIEEHRLRDVLAIEMNGLVEVAIGPFGRADVLTAALAIEVEPMRSWRHGLRQASAYALGTGLTPGLALFGQATRDRWLKIHHELRDGPVRLFAWTGTRWTEISANVHCKATG